MPLSQQQDIHKLKSECTVSNNSDQKDGGNNGNSYDHVFPALPDSLILTTKSIGINGECATSNALPKIWTAKFQSSTSNNVFTINVQDRKSDNIGKIGDGESKRICIQISRETGTEIEMFTAKNMDLTFLVNGQEEKVDEAKRRIIASFQIQATKSVPVPKNHHGHVMGKQGTRRMEIEQRTGARIQIPSVRDTSDVINVTGTIDAVERAVQEIQNISDELSKKAFETIEIPKKCHPFIAGSHNKKIYSIMKETGVKIHVPSLPDNSDEIKVFGDKKGVQLAVEKISEVFNEMRDIVTKEMVLGNVKVRNVIVNLGNKFIQSTKEDCGQNLSLKLPAAKSDNTIVITGPEDNVDIAMNQIQTMVDEVDISVFNLKVKPEYHKYLIGKKRANVLRIQGLTNTRIIFPPKTDSVELKNENIAIVGKKENIEKAKLEFEAMITNISNVVEDRVEINEKHHKSFIAKNGEFLHKLEEEFDGVKISFPKAGAGDKVVLKGTKANVAFAKQRLLEHAKVLENTIQIEVNVAPEFHRHFVTRNAEIIKRIIDDCNGVSITFPKLASNDDVVIIKGDKSNAEKAKSTIEKVVKDLENIIEITMSVPSKHHRHFVTRRAEVINQIITEHNGVTVTFPKFDSKSTEVLIKGHKDFVEKVKNKINHIVVDLEQRVNVDVIIPQKMHRFFLRNRDLLESLRRDLDVCIMFPKRLSENQYNREPEYVYVADENDENSAPSVNDIVTIFGNPENCESAKLRLIDNMPKTIDLNVPSEYHRPLIGTKGATIQKLSEDYNVKIHVPNQEQNSDIIKITGIPKNIAEVVEAIKREMRINDANKRDRQLRSYKIQMTIEPEFHPMVIGNKGKNVLNLSNKYGVQVNFPRKSERNNENIVTVVGYQKSAESARDEIQEMVDKLKNVYKEEIVIDNRIYSRLIGVRGRNISQIMDAYNVNIRFPKPDSTHSDLVIVYARKDATHDQVLDCIEYLKTIQQDYLTELLENEAKAKTKPNPENQSVPNGTHNSQGEAGFVIGYGAPWQIAHPDIKNTRDFPSFTHNAKSDNNAGSDKTNLPC